MDDFLASFSKPCSLISSALKCHWARQELNFRRSSSLADALHAYLFLNLLLTHPPSLSLSLSHLQPTSLTQWWTIFQQISAQGSTMAGPASVTVMSTKWWWALAGTLTTKIPRSQWSVQEKQHSLQFVWCLSEKESLLIAYLLIQYQTVFNNTGLKGSGGHKLNSSIMIQENSMSYK